MGDPTAKGGKEVNRVVVAVGVAERKGVGESVGVGVAVDAGETAVAVWIPTAGSGATGLHAANINPKTGIAKRIFNFSILDFSPRIFSKLESLDGIPNKLE
jgi:hypothetical protein